ncbi:MAG: preprotein translocase subunit YajC [Actinomycetaceae bacterium]|nr:preprotein translocase subunit YajC [Actinomycetaceae bacterium]
MEQFIQQNGLLIMIAVLFGVMMIFSSRSRKRMMEEQARREKQLAEDLVPGAWVHTAVGFWGRFVEQDGDIVILEAADGTETYWDRSVIREVAEPPFASDDADNAEAADDDVAEETEEKVLGLDEPTQSSGPIETSPSSDDKN